jgi:hypothetical protein
MYNNIKVRFGVLIFSGGLMKKSLKSLTLGVPAVLLLALLFLGCPQDSDDDGDSGSWSGDSYQKDVDGIAVAFADGAEVVYLKDNLHLGDYELVIPEGKTLDLTRGVTIDQIAGRGKLVVVGTINFAEGNRYDIRLYESSGARLIATTPFIEANVEVLEDEDSKELENSKHIKALESQIIHIADFDVRNPEAWQTYINENAGEDNDSYIPVRYNGITIDKAIADNISKYGSGRRVYIIGNVETESEIKIGPTVDPSTQPSTPSSPEPASNLYNVIDDGDGSLLIAGNLKVKENGTIKTEKGLTVLGTLATDDANLTVNEGGILVAYLLRLDKTGGTFKGPVRLIGTLPSNLGEGSYFNDDLTVNGSIILKAATFVGTHSWTFNGPVEFAGDKNSIINTSALILNGVVSITNQESPVEIFNESKFTLNEKATITYGVPFKTGTTSITFKKPVTFNNTAAFTGKAATIKFENGVTFNKKVDFAEDATITFGANGSSVYFARDLSLPANSIASKELKANVTFGADAEFTGDETVYFSGTLSALGKLTLKGGGTFTVAEVGNDFDVPAGKQLVVVNTFSYKSGLVKLGGTLGAGGSLASVIVGNTGIKFTDSGLVLGAGSLALGTVSVDIAGGGRITFESGTAIAGGTYGLILKGPDVSTYIDAGNYKITLGDAGNGWITSNGKGGQVILEANKISNGEGATGSLGVLALGGSYGAQKVLLTVKESITIDGVAVDLQKGGSIGVDANDSGAKLPVITLEGGSATAYVGGGGSVTLNPSGASAGAIIVGGTASEAVFGGGLFATNANGYTSPATAVPTGYIVSEKAKAFATALNKGTWSTAAGSVGTIGNNEDKGYIIGGSLNSGVAGSLGFFAPFWAPVESAAAANGIVLSDKTQKAAAGGSVAVFKYAPPPAPPAE